MGQTDGSRYRLMPPTLPYGGSIIDYAVDRAATITIFFMFLLSNLYLYFTVTVCIQHALLPYSKVFVNDNGNENTKLTKK